MPKIILKTIINSSIEICFDLSRSIDLHKISTAKTKEQAIDGKTSGLISLGEFVTWRATHFGISQNLTSQITKYEKPFHFQDVQLKGAFKYFIHDHYFKNQDGKVIMEDQFDFKSPFGFVGSLFDKFILTNYLKRFLEDRNNLIKAYAETDKWKGILNGNA